MRLRPLAPALAGALLAGAVLSGCPLPQPLPDYPEGQPVTPPRIVVNDGTRQVERPETVVRVPAGCAAGPAYDLAAHLRVANTSEVVIGRTFVNYDPANSSRVTPQGGDDRIDPPAPGAPDPTLRRTRTFTFRPYDFAPAAGTGAGDARSAGAVHVVDLVVSNFFDPSGDDLSAPLPFRTPCSPAAPGCPDLIFEVQLHRWVFVTVPESGDVPCP